MCEKKCFEAICGHVFTNKSGRISPRIKGLKLWLWLEQKKTVKGKKKWPIYDWIFCSSKKIRFVRERPNGFCYHCDPMCQVIQCGRAITPHVYISVEKKLLFHRDLKYLCAEGGKLHAGECFYFSHVILAGSSIIEILKKRHIHSNQSNKQAAWIYLSFVRFIFRSVPFFPASR